MKWPIGVPQSEPPPKIAQQIERQLRSGKAAPKVEIRTVYEFSERGYLEAVGNMSTPAIGGGTVTKIYGAAEGGPNTFYGPRMLAYLFRTEGANPAAILSAARMHGGFRGIAAVDDPKHGALFSVDAVNKLLRTR